MSGGNPEFQNLDSLTVPPPVTPADSPSSPAGYASVTPHGRGPAPYDIQAPQQDLSADVAAAGALTGAGVIYPQGPRQSLTEALLQSPQGFAVDGYDIDAGYHAGPGQDGWPSNVEPGGM
jgi:hypothetical protein